MSGLVILLYILKAAQLPGFRFLQGALSRWGNKGAMEEGMKEFEGVMGYVSLFVHTHACTLTKQNHTMCRGRAAGEEMEAKCKVTLCIP